MVDLNELAEGLWIEDYARGEEQQIEQRLENKQTLLSYKNMLKHPDGKRVLWDILTYCEAFQNAMTGNSWTYHKLGKQAVGQYVIMMLNLGNKFEDILEFQKLKPQEDE